MKALHAGYVSGALWQDIRGSRLPSTLDWMDVVSSLSHFVIDRDVAGSGSLAPEWSVFENILCRGLPTLPSIKLEKGLAEATGLLVVGEDGKQNFGAVNVRFGESVDDAMRESLARALCICASDVTLQPSSGFCFPEFGSGDDNTKFDSAAERTFWDGPLTDLLGPGGMQLALRQRSLESLVQGFPDQRVDVAVELPGWRPGAELKRGLVLEVDGQQHTRPEKKQLDAKRDEACRTNGWAETYRHRLWQGIPAEQAIDRGHVGVEGLLSHPYLDFVNRNACKPLQGTDAGRLARYVALAPFAIARIQSVLLELVKGGHLSVDAPVWSLVVIDRDGLPGVGQLAVDDLREWLEQIYALYHPERPVPEMRCAQASDTAALVDIPGWTDVIIDLSVEMRYGVRREPSGAVDDLLRSGCVVVIVRSDYYRHDPHHECAFSEPLTLKVAGEPLEQALTFFLQNIFRKIAFREKQVEIIRRALRGESVIALLPTGAGKSITYQLPTLLQNGMSAVVAPIKSLMKDQDDNLRAAGISCCAFINSMSTADEKRFNTGLMVRGCLKFAFISPERLIIGEFRDALQRMKDEARAHFAYVVVDEAHCVSEWGHDFRTAYLRLGANARRFCPTRWPALPLLALTGTASFEVLDDVKRELGFEHGGDISVRPERMERENLHFNVVQIPVEALPKGAAEKVVSDAVGDAKHAKLAAALDDLTTRACGTGLVPFLQAASGSGLIFCPHAGRKGGVHGAKTVASTLRKAVGPDEAHKIGEYFGSSEDGDGNGFDPVTVQNDFKADKLRVLACTKAFGMGIDKPDIRFTLHYNIPASLESFYQEAGRAGRDGGDAQCWLLYAGTPVLGKDHSLDFHLNHQFHRNSFPGAELEEIKVFEMLEQNRMPGNSAPRNLELYLAAVTGIGYSVQPARYEGNPSIYVYLNHPDHKGSKVFITINPAGNLSSTAKIPFPGDEHARDLAKDWLADNRPAGVAWMDWLFQKAGLAVNAGIEDILAQAAPDEMPRIYLSFENGYVEEIADRLGMTPADIKKAISFSDGIDGILAKLPKAKLAMPDVRAWVTEAFSKMRLREHTFRALYRLSTLGVVADFEADYASETLTTELVQLQQGECRENLRRYLHRHAPMEVEHYLRLADTSKQPSELRRCVHALVAFVYERIAKQRIQALTIMEQTCVRGIADANAFREAVTYFFDSLYLPRLRPHLQKYDSDLVFETIKDTTGSTAKLSHLLGACNRLLPENPENAALRALHGYAMALLGYTESDAVSELESAAEKFASAFGWTRQKKLTFLDDLRRWFLRVPDASTAVIDTVILNEHRRWLEMFNANNPLPADARNPDA